MTAVPGTPLPEGAVVLRVLKKIPMFFEPGDSRQPTRKAFEPTEEDLASVPVGVSVFDRERTTFEQAVAIREHMSGRSLGDPVRVQVDVDAIRRVGLAHGSVMDVIADPIPDLDMPGADGHALITGLEKGTDEGSAHWKARLSALARVAIAA